jgi:hypothetical protein
VPVSKARLRLAAMDRPARLAISDCGLPRAGASVNSYHNASRRYR